MSPMPCFGRVWRSLGWVALGLAVLYVLALLASGWSLSRARAALVRHGRPMTFAELVPAALPEVDNAALLYSAATQLLKATPWQPARPLIEVAAYAAKEWVDGDVWAGQEAALEAPFREPALAIPPRTVSCSTAWGRTNAMATASHGAPELPVRATRGARGGTWSGPSRRRVGLSEGRWQRCAPTPFMP